MKIQRSNSAEWTAAAGAVATGLLLFAAFPPLEWTWAAWVALVPLWVVARQVPTRLALKMGFVAGLLFWLLSIRWLTNVTALGWLAVCA